MGRASSTEPPTGRLFLAYRVTTTCLLASLKVLVWRELAIDGGETRPCAGFCLTVTPVMTLDLACSLEAEPSGSHDDRQTNE